MRDFFLAKTKDPDFYITGYELSMIMQDPNRYFKVSYHYVLIAYSEKTGEMMPCTQLNYWEDECRLNDLSFHWFGPDGHISQKNYLSAREEK